VLAGPESVWHSESTFFECGCGKDLTLANRLDEHDAVALAQPRGRPGGHR
jgi:hypothetical protein